MPRSRGADADGMETLIDEPWMVFARRPAPLADLVWSGGERMRGSRSRVDYDGPEEDQPPLADAGTTPEPPDTVG
jgi:hypothetical protein